MEEVKAQPKKRRFNGVVVSDKMAKTIVVRVDSGKRHPKYGKYYTTSKRFQVHDELGKYHVGDEVQFEECRPLSRHKRWRVVDNSSNGKK